MPKKPLPQNVIDLTAEYRAAQERLVKLIADQQARGNSTYYRKRILAGVDAELKALDEYTKRWVADEIPKSYQSGMNQSYDEYRRQGIPFDTVPPNSKVINTLVRNVSDDLTEATRFVGRRIADDLRKAGLQAAALGIASGDTVKQTKAKLLEIMSDRGIQSIVDKNGRAIELDVYASMVSRTTTREATNTGAIQAVTDNGGDLVKMSQHFSSCPVCSVYEGRVYSISGDSTEYPPLSVAFKGYNSIHPNCTHVVMPYVPEYADNVEQTRTESNRPFEIEKKKQASIDAYNRDQAVKIARRTDRNQWNDALLKAPDDTPRTFSAFRAVKRSNNERYQRITSKLT